MQESLYYSLLSEECLECPECKGQIIQMEHEKVCEKCGLVISNLKLTNSYQINELKNSEFSPGAQFVSIGKKVDNVCNLGSFIGYFSSNIFYDYKHSIINKNQQRKFRKLKKFYSLPSKIKNHETDYRILKILNDASKYLNITNVVKDRAAYFYQMIKKKANTIKNHVTLIAFCIFYASRENNAKSPLSIKELCEIFNNMGHRINPKLIIRDSLEYKKFIKIKSKPHNSADYIPRFVNHIVNCNVIQKRMIKKGSNWNKEKYRMLLIHKCKYILSKLKFQHIGSRNPFILAGAVVYCADKLISMEYKSKSILTQKCAANAMGIPEYSIRDHYVKILKPFFSL